MLGHSAVSTAPVSALATAAPTYTLIASTGTFVLTGQAAALLAGRKLAAATGVFTLTGLAANLVKGRHLVAAPGSFVLTGNAAGLLAGRRLVAGTGVYVLTGNAAGGAKIQSAPRYNRWAPRPLVALTIGAATKRYSTEDVETS